jgi:hypothetical protein
LQDQWAGRRNHLVMGRKPTPALVHRLSFAEQRVLASFLAGRLPAGQLDVELQRARMEPDPVIEPVIAAAPAVDAQPAAAPVPAIAV